MSEKCNESNGVNGAGESPTELIRVLVSIEACDALSTEDVRTALCEHLDGRQAANDGETPLGSLGIYRGFVSEHEGRGGKRILVVTESDNSATRVVLASEF